MKNLESQLFEGYRNKLAQTISSIKSISRQEALNQVDKAIRVLRKEQPNLLKQMGNESAEKRDVQTLLKYLMEN